jgi:hypothetical protein
MTFRESAIMDRAFGLDAIVRTTFLRYGSMLYVLNQVPDVSASSTGLPS